MWSRHIGFTNQKIKDCLISSAVKLGAGTFDNAWGNGRVNAEAALRCGDVVVLPSVVGPQLPAVADHRAVPDADLAQCPTIIPVRVPVADHRAVPVARARRRARRRCRRCARRRCPRSRRVPRRRASSCSARRSPQTSARILARCRACRPECPSRLAGAVPDDAWSRRPAAGSRRSRRCAPARRRSRRRARSRSRTSRSRTRARWARRRAVRAVVRRGRVVRGRRRRPAPQPFPGPESAAASPETAEWYWLDDQGGTHYWSGGGA